MHKSQPNQQYDYNVTKDKQNPIWPANFSWTKHFFTKLKKIEAYISSFSKSFSRFKLQGSEPVLLQLIPIVEDFLLHRWHYFFNTITYKSRLTQKKLHKKNDAIFSIYEKNGIIPWHFFWILSWAFWGRWGRMKIEVKFLRLRPRNFAIIPDTFSPHLKMVR